MMTENAEPKKSRFGRAQKIKSKKEISSLFKNGRRWECDCFVLIFGQNDNNLGRFAVLVSRKNGNAVKRNRIKRIFREIYRLNFQNIPPSCDILVKIKIKEPDFLWNFGEQEGHFCRWMSKKF